MCQLFTDVVRVKISGSTLDLKFSLEREREIGALFLIYFRDSQLLQINYWVLDAVDASLLSHNFEKENKIIFYSSQRA